MNKQYFMIKLLPCRPDFAQTMTAEERSVMQEHVVFWKEHMEKGVMLIFGPVLDPRGTYGLGIVLVENEEKVKELIAKDPASKINTYEYFPMLALVPEK